jgi:hypothetical protein
MQVPMEDALTVEKHDVEDVASNQDAISNHLDPLTDRL